MTETQEAHLVLLDAIDQCLSDSEPKVQKAGVLAAKEALKDARGWLQFLRSNNSDPSLIEEARFQVEDFKSRAGEK